MIEIPCGLPGMCCIHAGGGGGGDGENESPYPDHTRSTHENPTQLWNDECSTRCNVCHYPLVTESHIAASHVTSFIGSKQDRRHVNEITNDSVVSRRLRFSKRASPLHQVMMTIPSLVSLQFRFSSLKTTVQDRNRVT